MTSLLETEERLMKEVENLLDSEDASISYVIRWLTLRQIDPEEWEKLHQRTESHVKEFIKDHQLQLWTAMSHMFQMGYEFAKDQEIDRV